MKSSRQKSSVGFTQKLSYMGRWLPGYAWQRLIRRVPDRVHLILCMADRSKPSIVPGGGAGLPFDEQERRLERWCREYPIRFSEFRDAEGQPLVHTYFYPAEQYDRSLVGQLADIAARAGEKMKPACIMEWGVLIRRETHARRSGRIPGQACR